MNLLHHSPLSHFHSISDKKYLFEYLSSSSGFETTTTTNHSWNLKVRRLDCFISLVTWLVSGDEQNSVDENINITLYVFGIVRHTRRGILCNGYYNFHEPIRSLSAAMHNFFVHITEKSIENMAILKTVCFFHESAKFIVSNISQTQKKGTLQIRWYLFY